MRRLLRVARSAEGVFVALALCLSLPAHIRAQTCVGAASFSAGKVRLGGAASFTDGSNTFGVQIAIGAMRALFVSGGLGRVVDDEQGASRTVLAGTIGYSVPVAAAVQLCPVLSYSHTSDPDTKTRSATTTSNGSDLRVGASLGMRVGLFPATDLIPYVSAAYAVATTDVSAQDMRTVSAVKGYSVLMLGAGLVLDKIVTLRPSVGFPVARDGAKPWLQILIGFNLGSSIAASLSAIR